MARALKTKPAPRLMAALAADGTGQAVPFIAPPRHLVVAAITALIELLDAVDGDPDLEAETDLSVEDENDRDRPSVGTIGSEDDAEPSGDDEPDHDGERPDYDRPDYRIRREPKREHVRSVAVRC